MNTVEPTTSGGVSCRLIRRDGTEWAVSRFDLRNGGAWVTASRPSEQAGGERVLSEEPLGYGDRLEWLRADGSIVWAMRNPTGVGLRWDEEDGADHDTFFDGDFREVS